MKRIASLVILGASALAFIVRCSEPVHECGKDVNCGDPGDLAGKTAPGPPNAQGADSNNNNNTQGVDASVANLCAPIAGDGGCSISFTKDILGKKLGAAGTWGCAASGCHDPQGGSEPRINTDDPAYTYKHMYTNGAGGLPYVNPCSTDPAKSAFVGNLSNPSTAGQHMPLGHTDLPSQSDIDTIIKPWIQCGSPLN